MKAYWAFTKKELTEYFRTAKIMILGAVFLLFGMMNPVMAKFTPEIIKAAGLDIKLPEPTALDSWAQFYKNISQMGMIVMIIVFSGIMANELSKGTLINILTKGLKRKTVILAKFSVASLLWTLSYLLCLGVTALYTAYFWSLAGMHQVLLAFFTPWLYGEFLIAVLILGGVLFKNVLGSLLLVGGVTVVLSLISIFPQLQKYDPIILSGDGVALLNAAKGVGDFLPATLICAILTFSVMFGALVLFDHQAL